ncbi:hypothetical protein PL8927_320006 [Planktothrix serta PCC 8927]|uniref:Uncharacterized protein n=1 Tax=Planktothrix serta PCC 8927 TaxID=671068 RepID=A0A7Z9BL13_9CYAN|nr:hypothetical protein PL8927_320006 [Planktothrix serta PCC 8927]
MVGIGTYKINLGESMLLLSLRCPELAEGSKYPTLIWWLFFSEREIQCGTYRSPKPPRQLNLLKFQQRCTILKFVKSNLS